MVTCKIDSAMPKMAGRPRKTSSHSSGFRLMDNDQLDTVSSVSRNSIYKLKIDLMFDDSRSVRSSNHLDDRRGSQRTRSIIMYGRHDLASTASLADSNFGILQERDKNPKILTESVKKDVRRISNSVQAQIERMFTDVAKDATCSFSVTCLGSLALKDKVTSLQGLQEPLRQLYLNDGDKKHNGCLDICASGLRVKNSINNGETEITPFHNIAVWSAVKFVVSNEDGTAAFLPLITDPDNIDKSILFHPLNASEIRRTTSGQHAPLFAVVMRSSSRPKLLECHGFVCQSAEDAIVIAATLYQSLMAHVSSNSSRNTKRRTPRNQNGVSCVSIASSSAMTGSNYLSRSSIGGSISVGRKVSLQNSVRVLPPIPSRPLRKKRTSTSSLSGDNDQQLRCIENAETTTEERKRKSHKTKRAPPIPCVNNSSSPVSNSTNSDHNSSVSCADKKNRSKGHLLSNGTHAGNNANAEGIYRKHGEANGDILTRVAIPRSGSFLNTGGLTRYKSRAARRHSGKSCGGGGSPLGFSELFNEFRLHENLHSLDDILYAIIDADGMSFNDLKPIYKEFLLKLAVTLTKDELYQRSKNIMRRQKKKKLKRRNSTKQKKSRTLIIGTKGLKKVFQMTQFRSCVGKPPKQDKSNDNISISLPVIPQKSTKTHCTKNQNRVTTSGSDVSVVRTDQMIAVNRNSSSGYVSCSECSYDSEACTCTSADRCYCSLGADHDCVNEKLRRNRSHQQSNGNIIARNLPDSHYNNSQQNNRNSYISCKSEDKCYCSMAENNGEEEEDDDNVSRSVTTWCDSDSCVSASKCYCKHTHRIDSLERRIGTKNRKNKDNMGLDYELFTVGGNGRPVNSHDALSVKKSVEAAAIFADVKLSQTTDIKSLCPLPSKIVGSTVSSSKERRHRSESRNDSVSNKSSIGSKKLTKRRESASNDRHKSKSNSSSPTSQSHKSNSVDDILSKLNAIGNIGNEHEKHSIGSCSSKYVISKNSIGIGNGNHLYQSTRSVGSSLEDTLGYLP